MGWTLTTTMWRDRNPVTGQARVTGTPERPGLSASFNDRNGKPLVFQLNGPRLLEICHDRARVLRDTGGRRALAIWA